MARLLALLHSPQDASEPKTATHHIPHTPTLEGNNRIPQDQDIIHVKQLLGHKKIDNTMIYINLEKAIFKESNDEFTVKVVEDVDEARKLLEVGFEYVCDMDDKKLFRKRK